MSTESSDNKHSHSVKKNRWNDKLACVDANGVALGLLEPVALSGITSATLTFATLDINNGNDLKRVIADVGSLPPTAPQTYIYQVLTPGIYRYDLTVTGNATGFTSENKDKPVGTFFLIVDEKNLPNPENVLLNSQTASVDFSTNPSFFTVNSFGFFNVKKHHKPYVTIGYYAEHYESGTSNATYARLALSKLH